ncbi:SDR family NAD(P)-dependent oxidoreductase [Micromonospora sp. NBC_01699]|uniref:SDR family NAD(P)-dependent oxidoreductase n=1 Tax=Micromonospora sp. NBC_01699 TaxID=2975984 RepID=UPI002E2F3DAC|nr:SDR family NAD(P)-dependent oxidoreductase [Micromonospora sp. NBC_01699]
MRTIVISGGTDGMGRALASTYLGRGDNVVIVGRDPAKGAAFLAGADRDGAGSRAQFIRADLSLVAENRRVVAEIAASRPVVDVLVFCARHYRSNRTETAEGLEGTFALDYLSRYLLGHGLVEQLERAVRPVVVNVSGPGIAKPEIRWDDPGLAGDYDGFTAQFQAGRANDLLGIAFAAVYPASRTRYVLLHPGGVATSLSGDYDEVTAAQVEAMRRSARPVGEGIVPIVAVIDAPPAEPVSAFMRERRIDLSPGSADADAEAATRLHRLTGRLLSALPGDATG